jgi:D-alanyl-lipoteichoic acid acyltransferase DltB (MBOAT superfamily)
MEKFAKEEGWGSGSTLVRVVWVVFPIVALLSLVLPPYMTLASLSYFLMVAGFLCRKERVNHFRLMSTAMILDLVLVAVLELQRSAVETAVRKPLTPPQGVHVVCSLAAVLLYVPIAVLGWRNFHGKRSPIIGKIHRRLGILTFTFRTLGYIFMFSMMK